MKIRWQYALGGLLALLGFSGCGKIGWGMTEYGQPHANYKVLGEVKDPDGKPIEGIRVVVNPGPEHPSYFIDTLYTDAKGQFQKEQLRYTWPDEFKEGKVKFEDVDGAENGSFKTKELKASDLSIKQDKKGDGRWYGGDFTITANATLEKDE